MIVASPLFAAATVDACKVLTKVEVAAVQGEAYTQTKLTTHGARTQCFYQLPTFTKSDSMGNPVLTFNIGTLTPNDVGKTAILITLPAESKAPGSPLEINTGDAEGTTVGLDIPSVSTATLGVNDIVLSSDHLVNEGDEYRIDYAIEKLGNTRATVGAQIVSLHMSADNASIASVNYVAAESRIRDADIGAETVAYTRDVILRNVQTHLTASLEQLQLGLMQLVTASILGSR